MDKKIGINNLRKKAKGLFEIISEYLNVSVDPEISRQENRKACWLLLGCSILCCLTAFIMQEVLYTSLPTLGPLLGLIFFIVLTGMCWNYREYIRNKPTYVLKVLSYLILFYLAFLDGAFYTGQPGCLFFVMVIAVPLLVMESPGKLLLMTLLPSALFVVCTLIFGEEGISEANILRLIPVLIVSMFLTCRISHERIIAIERNASSQDLAEHDPLTGILNRGGGSLLIRNYLQQRMSGAFLIIDIDDFKFVNDNYGHQKGDEVLQDLAATLRDSFKSSDIVMRMGGDEFVVYALGMVDSHVTEYRLEQLIDHIHQIMIDEENGIYVTVSIGCVINDGSYPDYESMYKAADRFLYRTKENGKNGFNIYNVSFRES